MEIVMDLLLMLGGVAVFMYGMKQMSTGMEQSAGAGVRKLFKKINKNRFIDYGIGIGATAIVQSSSATSIMTVGLANAGIVTVKQGSGIVLGAKVGTTLTAFLFALRALTTGAGKSSFSVTTVFAAVAFVGVIIMYTTNKDSLNKVALFLVGFGILFVGLEVMESAIGGKDSALAIPLTKLFNYDVMKNPVFLVILGVLFTSIIQSSTAATGVFIAFLSAGVITGVDQAFFLVMGANIGTCSDGIMAAIGTNANGKRIAAFHTLTSTIGAVAFSIILALFRQPIVGLFSEIPNELSLVLFNLLYNSIYTLILLAFLNPLVKLVSAVFKDSPPRKDKKQTAYNIDERLLATPTIAIEQALREVYSMTVLAEQNLARAFDGMIKGDLSKSKLIADQEYKIDNMTRALASYFIKISSLSLSARDEKLIGGLHHVINDVERMGDYAVMIAKETSYMVQLDTQFVSQTKAELNDIYDKITKLFELSLDTFKTRKITNLKSIAELHYEINGLISSVRDVHTERLSSNMYPVEVSKSLYTALISLQRVADHIVNIAFSIRSDTGSKTEAFAIIEKDKKKQI